MSVGPLREAEFADFVADAEPRLRRALTALRGPEDGRDATSEALAWAWENWSEVEAMENPIGYLYRVGCSRSRLRSGPLPIVTPPAGANWFEPGLAPALAGLSERQRGAVVLVHGFGWTHQEVADALGISRSSVAVHLRRAMHNLRRDLGVKDG